MAMKLIRSNWTEKISCPKYGRMEITLPIKNEENTSIEITGPDGLKETIPSYLDQPAEFRMDQHGYEALETAGEPCRRFRYTPERPGSYRWQAVDCPEISGSFFCTESEEPGYVQVSQKDPRYFACTSGASYVPIGPNACILRYDALPRGEEHFATGDQYATLGISLYRRWFAQMRDAGVNYTRLWLSSVYLDTRTRYPGRHDLAKFHRLDTVMELAREYGIRVKLCLEHFRCFGPSPDDLTKPSFVKELWDERTHQPYQPEQGRMEEWLTSPYWNQKWQEDIEPYLARYANDPIVFAWELWNEMDCVAAPYEQVLDFTSRMAQWLRSRSPRNMICNSTGSFDWEGKIKALRQMASHPALDFGQFHRYVDQGAKMEICHADALELAADGVRQMRVEGRPVILNETGAVNDCHTGPFRFYPMDHAGTILNDVTYAPFFAGAAGSGHSWHWEYYVDPQELWQNYQPLIRLLQGIQVDEEAFETFEMSMESVRLLGLRGRKHTLLYVRSAADRWDRLFRDQQPAVPVENLHLPFSSQRTQIIGLREDEHLNGCYELSADQLQLPASSHGFVARLEAKA